MSLETLNAVSTSAAIPHPLAYFHGEECPATNTEGNDRSVAGRWYCPYCWYWRHSSHWFSTAGILNRHIDRDHNNIDMTASYVCLDCENVFRLSSVCANHKQTHTCRGNPNYKQGRVRTDRVKSEKRYVPFFWGQIYPVVCGFKGEIHLRDTEQEVWANGFCVCIFLSCLL